MKPISEKTRYFFKECGRRGGRTRAAALSCARRAEIARHAASLRWAKRARGRGPSFLVSTRLREPRWNDPVYLEEILAYGTLEDWREIYRRLANHPFGEEAQALQKVCNAVRIYGATPLWKGIVQTLQGGQG